MEPSNSIGQPGVRSSSMVAGENGYFHGKVEFFARKDSALLHPVIRNHRLFGNSFRILFDRLSNSLVLTARIEMGNFTNTSNKEGLYVFELIQTTLLLSTSTSLADIDNLSGSSFFFFDISVRSTKRTASVFRIFPNSAAVPAGITRLLK